MDKIVIVKIGGNVIDDPPALEKLLTDFATLQGAKILVHGGGKLATDMASQLNVPQKMVNGRRITDLETLKITTMVYAGLINKQIVASLQSKKNNAIGLSGADGNSIQSEKRKVVETDYGFVGDIHTNSVNLPFIKSILELGITPVFSAITHDGQNQLLNTNADTIASALAVALSGFYNVQLNYCFEKKGVLKDMEDDNSVIETMTPRYYKELLKDGIISKGMIPKLDNAFEAIQKGVKSVLIAHSNDLLNTTHENKHAGTKLIAG
ncbi:MAG TPA: acetylglutamate kinase [Bacteroidia bacterium]|nr:acetylglutamate kinase [Bacteroidia bacterium]